MITDSDINNNPSLCYNIAKTEYDHCIKRLERLDNKIYILLTALAFIVVLLTGSISKLSGVNWSDACVNAKAIVVYILLTISATVLVILLLTQLIISLSSVEIKRFDSCELMEKNMTHVDEKSVAKYVIAKYAEAINYNNKLIDERYHTFNNCVIIMCISVIILLLSYWLGLYLP